jgi:hypothetical protein
VKLKLQWRPKEFGNARKVEHQPRKATGSNEEPAMKRGYVGCKQHVTGTGTGPPKSCGAHIMPQSASDAGYGAI